MPGEMGIPLDTAGSQILIRDAKDTTDVNKHGTAPLMLLSSGLYVLKVSVTLEEVAFNRQ